MFRLSIEYVVLQEDLVRIIIGSPLYRYSKNGEDLFTFNESEGKDGEIQTREVELAMEREVLGKGTLQFLITKSLYNV